MSVVVSVCQKAVLHGVELACVLPSRSGAITNIGIKSIACFARDVTGVATLALLGVVVVLILSDAIAGRNCRARLDLWELRFFNTLVNLRDRHSLAVEAAARGDDVEYIRQLRRLGVDVLEPDPMGRTLLRQAIRSGRTAIIELLVEIGCDFNLPINNGDGRPTYPLFEAIKSGDVEIFERICSIPGINLSVVEREDCTDEDVGLGRAIIRSHESDEMFRILERFGYDFVKKGEPYAKDVALFCKPVLVDYFINKLHMDLSTMDSAGRLIQVEVVQACRVGTLERPDELELFNYLLSRGVSFRECDSKGCTAMVEAARRGNVKVLQAFRELGMSLNQEDGNGESPLAALGAGVTACSYNYHVGSVEQPFIDTLEFFVAAGVSLYDCQPDGSTFATSVARNRTNGGCTVAKMRLLQSKGVNLLAKDGKGQTPLECTLESLEHFKGIILAANLPLPEAEPAALVFFEREEVDFEREEVEGEAAAHQREAIFAVITYSRVLAVANFLEELSRSR